MIPREVFAMESFFVIFGTPQLAGKSGEAPQDALRDPAALLSWEGNQLLIWPACD